MRLESGLEVPTQEIAELCRTFGIRELAIFVSAARGGIRPDADIDVVIDFLPETKYGWDEYIAIEERLQSLLRREVDLGTKRRVKPRVRDRIAKEATVIYVA